MLSKRSLERVRGFGWEATARRLYSLFEEVLDEQRGPRQAA
jgi:hypothetical protein